MRRNDNNNQSRRAERAFDVLVVGDANPDLVLRGDVVPRFGQVEQVLDAAELVLGGSAAIVACGLAKLGVRVELVACVGADVFGRITLDALVRRGVGVSAVRQEAATPTGLSVVLSRPGDRAIFTLPGTIPALAPEQVTGELLANARHVHLASVFLLPGIAAGLPGLLRRARAAGCTASVDTNWDPAGRFSGVREALGLVDVYLPNAAELLKVTGRADGTVGRVEVAAAAAEIRALGPVVAVKDGAAGAYGVGPDGPASAPAVPVDVVDTTGAGDSFDAGFLAAWLDGRPVGECLAWGAAAGSLSTRAAGGTAAQPTRAELQAALA